MSETYRYFKLNLIDMEIQSLTGTGMTPSGEDTRCEKLIKKKMS